MVTLLVRCITDTGSAHRVAADFIESRLETFLTIGRANCFFCPAL